MIPEHQPGPAAAAKGALRTRIFGLVRNLAPGDCETQSARACALLESRPEWARAERILAYAPLPGELDLWPAVLRAIAWGKTVALPRFDAASGVYQARQVANPSRDLEPGRYRIREPRPGCALVALKRLDFILAPGVGFDLHGHRLGRGKGYFDRLLADVVGTTCGAGYEEQIVENIPVEPHDVALNCILTPVRWVVCQRRAPVPE